MPEGFHQAAKYIVVPGVHQPTFMWEVVVKQETWDKVPADLKPLIEAAAELTTQQGLDYFYDADMKAMAKYRSRSEEHTSELQSLMRISYAVFCLKKQTIHRHNIYNNMLHII